MMPAPLSRDLHDVISAETWRLGVRILQGNRLGRTDEEHVAKLLELMSPPVDARILDVGCGFGEVARIMHLMRPDLRFGLLNDSAVQLAMAPVGEPYVHICADLHRTGSPGAFFDGAMALYSLCHADLLIALAEIARVVRPGGFLFVYDYDRTGGDNDLMERHLRAVAHRADETAAACYMTGWLPQWRHSARGDDSLFRGLMNDDETYDAIFNDLEPVIWRAVRS